MGPVRPECRIASYGFGDPRTAESDGMDKMPLIAANLRKIHAKRKDPGPSPLRARFMKPTARILLINGPNLNLLGSRERRHYGDTTLAEIESRLKSLAQAAGAELSTYQSNSEAQLVDRIQQAGHEHTDFIIINPAAYTHTSVAMRDALAAVGIPFIEVHVSNVYAREPFRQRSYFSDLAIGVVSGFGASGYEIALAYALRPDRAS